MAGHSQFKNIMYRKGAQDAKRSKLFSKLAREIQVAARTGMSDPEMNPRLRAAIVAARAANMPKDNIERAVKRGAAGEDGANYEEVRYEGYGPAGIAVIVEALTDNRNRTAAEVAHNIQISSIILESHKKSTHLEYFDTPTTEKLVSEEIKSVSGHHSKHAMNRYGADTFSPNKGSGVESKSSKKESKVEDSKREINLLFN